MTTLLSPSSLNGSTEESQELAEAYRAVVEVRILALTWAACLTPITPRPDRNNNSLGVFHHIGASVRATTSALDCTLAPLDLSLGSKDGYGQKSNNNSNMIVIIYF